MQTKKHLLILLLGCANLVVSAQFHQPVYPGLSGQELVDSLVAGYKAPTLLPQAMARDTLFGKIDNHNDSLTCVYTGFTIWLDPAEDPTQAAYMNGGPDGLNTEHTWPKSMGATGLAEGDMHHLYPTRIDVNADRGSFPFADIPDAVTERWYYLDQEMNSIPSANIDAYSEWVAGRFEPREDHKGNVARSMMYFYTMYRDQADQADPTFFEVQRQTLCAWHFQDPVDAKEWNRTWAIAPYQSGKPNPFVLDCTLPERTYCSDFGQTCTVASTEKERLLTSLRNFPNPVGEETTFTWQQPAAGQVQLTLVDALGRTVTYVCDEKFSEGSHELKWQRPAGLPAGPFFYQLRLETPEGVFFSFGKMLLLPR
ncbi:MAG: hypothetical protein Kow0027_25520 [Saprospiraceae bacterium]